MFQVMTNRSGGSQASPCPRSASVLSCHVPDLALPGRERRDRPPDAEGPDERVERVLPVAADHDGLPNRWPAQRCYPSCTGHLSDTVLCHIGQPLSTCLTV